jgi:predicted N-acetyltransferase YhbS
METRTGQAERRAEGAATLRPGRPEDAEACGRICYEAFGTLAEQHGFPPDFPSAEVATGVCSMLLSHPGFYSVVADLEGRVVGSNFLDERSLIAGVGPITVDPHAQDAGIGRRLMVDVLERAGAKTFPGVRLLQAAYHNRSLSLYAKLGFEIREPVANLAGSSKAVSVPGYDVRPARKDDLEACNAVCIAVHGHDRSGEVVDAIAQGAAMVVEHDGRITGYSTGIGFLAHAVGLGNPELRALIGAAKEMLGPGFLLPARNGELFRWCLEQGFRLRMMTTLMTVGLYNEPAGAYLPSILY